MDIMSDADAENIISSSIIPKDPLSTLEIKAAESPLFDSCLSEEERHYYRATYPNVDYVRDCRVHCTVCRTHLGTAPAHLGIIKMHPILRVTHCLKCHDFYNSGEFSRGEDGSELYCRWCGQGGEVYCCSNCPYVFCKSCIVKNLKRDVISDIEKNENWLCFSCSPKILWPLRSQHWALMQFIAQQTEEIQSQVLEADEYEKRMNHDSSHCCRLARSRASNISGSVDSLNSSSSKKSDINNVKKRKRATILMSPSPTTSKRQKVNHSYSNKSSSSNSNGNDNTSSMNDEVVCTPDLVSMLEPDCQLSASPQTMDPPSSVNTSTPPPLVLRNSSVQIRSIRDGSAYPNQTSMNSPVYHVVNGFRIDLNSAAQQGSVRLPNGKVIQVKRTGGMPSIPSPAQSPYAVSPSTNMNNANYTSINNNWPRPCEVRPIISQQPLALPRVNFPHSITSLPTVASINMNNISGNNLNTNNNNNNNGDSAAVRLPIVRQVFPKTAIGEGRSHLQDKVLEAQSICHRFSGKLISFTNSNAYKDVKSYTDLKELYIHMSFMCTYVAESMQKLQDDVLQEMRLLGFGREADDLKQGQLPAGVDYLRTPEEIPETYAGSDDDYNDDYDEDANGDVNGDVASPRSNGKVKHEVKNGEPNESSLGQLLEDADNSEEGAGDEDEEYQEEERSKMGTEEAMYREEQAHSNDHKLTRLVQQYPAIWCTMHPNYGNFEVTRQHWRNIASYFARTDNVKARWKNIRKRFVRVEQRLRDGKRFKGSFDKASNFLLNRNIPPEDWQEVDCGTDDSDGYFIDRAARGKGAATKKDNVEGAGNIFCEKANPNDNLPIDILPIDLKIINYVKRTPVLWRRVRNGNSHDEDSIRQLWVTLVKTLPGVSCDDIVYRWHYLYEMYKAFRLKHIKNKQLLANMELKYSKYLSKLYFLYKIDEDVLRNECTMVNDDAYELEGLEEHLEYSENDQLKRMQEEPDDKKFALELIRTVSAYPALYDMRHFDYGDPIVRGKNWLDVSRKLANFKRDVNQIKLRWLLIKYNYHRYLRDRLRPTKWTVKFLNQVPIEELNFLKNITFHR